MLVLKGFQHFRRVVLAVDALASEGPDSSLFLGILGFLPCFFEPLGVLRDLQLVDTFLDIAVHEHGQVVHAPADAVVGDAACG